MGAAAAMAVDKKVVLVKPAKPPLITQEEDVECFLVTLPPQLIARAVQILRGTRA